MIRHNPGFSYTAFSKKREQLAAAIREWADARSAESAASVREVLVECEPTLRMLKWMTPFYTETLGRSLAAHAGMSRKSNLDDLAARVYGDDTPPVARIEEWVLQGVAHLYEHFEAELVARMLAGAVSAVYAAMGKEGAFDEGVSLPQMELRPTTGLWLVKEYMEATRGVPVEVEFAVDRDGRDVIYSKIGLAGVLYELFLHHPAHEVIYGAGVQSPYSGVRTVRAKWGEGAAGILFYCEDDDTVLLGCRAERVFEPYKWGIPGGSVAGEHASAGSLGGESAAVAISNATFWTGAARETEEECGGLPPGFDVRNVPYYVDFVQGSFVYRTFIYRVSKADKDAWAIRLNNEHIAMRWWPADDIPPNTLANVRAVIDELVSYTTGEARSNDADGGRRNRRRGARRRAKFRRWAAAQADALYTEGQGLARLCFWTFEPLKPMWAFARIELLHFFGETLHFSNRLRKGDIDGGFGGLKSAQVTADTIITRLADYKSAPESTRTVSRSAKGAAAYPRALVFSWPYEYVCKGGWKESVRPRESNPINAYGDDFVVIFATASATVSKSSAFDFQEVTLLGQIRELVPCMTTRGVGDTVSVHLGLSGSGDLPLFTTGFLPNTWGVPCRVVEDLCGYLSSDAYDPSENLNATPLEDPRAGGGAIRQATVGAYRNYLEELLREYGVWFFAAGGGERTAYPYLSVCCGGFAPSRIEGFINAFGGLDSGTDPHTTQIDISMQSADPLLPDGRVRLRNSLSGYMTADVVVLFFRDMREYELWRAEKLESVFLTLTTPVNHQKTFVVVSAVPFTAQQELQQLVGASSVVSVEMPWAPDDDSIAGARADLMSILQGALRRAQYRTPCEDGLVLVPGFYDPVTRHEVAPFLASQCEITQRFYENVTGVNPSTSRGAALPVTDVTWFDIVAFANALSGHDACYEDRGDGVIDISDVSDCVGFKLPTTAQFGQMAGAFGVPVDTSTEADVCAIAWCSSNAEGRPHPVGQLRSTAMGIYDIFGNVAEWGWDAQQTRRRPQPRRVMEGGSYVSAWSALNPLSGMLRDPGTPSERVGGRLIRRIPTR